MIAFSKVVDVRHRYLDLRFNRDRLVVTSLFPKITYRDIDKSFTHALKYHTNFFFYNFGLEVSSSTDL